MTGGWEHGIVIVVLAAAALFAARGGWRAWRAVRAPAKSCNCGCSSASE